MDKEKFMGIGGLVAAGIGSICCAAPVILAGLVLGTSAHTFVRNLGFLEIPMMVLAIGLLGTAFFYHFKKKAAESGEECCKTQPGKSREA